MLRQGPLVLVDPEIGRRMRICRAADCPVVEAESLSGAFSAIETNGPGLSPSPQN